MHRLLFLLLAATAFAARAAGLVPTTPGTSWEYEVRNGAQSSHRMIRLVGREEIAGNELVRCETLEDGALLKTELIRIDERGVALHQRANGKTITFEPPQVIVPAPPALGATWDVHDPNPGGEQFRRFRFAAEEDITVPAGKFRAWRIECEQPWPVSSRLQRWFAPGVGFVKEVEVTRGPSGRLLSRVTTLLRRFSPGVSSVADMAATERPSAEISLANELPSSTPSEMSAPSPEIHLELASGRDGPATNEFRSDVPNIFVRWNGRHLPVDAPVRIAWIAEDVGDIAPPNFIVDEIERTVATPEFGGRFTLSRPKDGWAAGKYRAELYLEDELRATAHVTIRD
ncbi:MAG TPA: hypothetical protein VG095_05990 [Chthoniobacterales bacterium]|nr:hypothetical protein [Chthoniobacterales bacterium]